MHTLKLTTEEAMALLVLVDEGAEAILTDEQAVNDLLGGEMGAAIAQAAIDRLVDLVNEASMADADDGQPSEMQEWRDFDPDC